MILDILSIPTNDFRSNSCYVTEMHGLGTCCLNLNYEHPLQVRCHLRFAITQISFQNTSLVVLRGHLQVTSSLRQNMIDHNTFS